MIPLSPGDYAYSAPVAEGQALVTTTAAAAGGDGGATAATSCGGVLTTVHDSLYTRHYCMFFSYVLVLPPYPRQQPSTPLSAWSCASSACPSLPNVKCVCKRCVNKVQKL